MDYREIIFEQTETIAIITLNTPEKINALSLEKIGEITHALEKISTDETVKVLIIKASGNHFCAGHDLSELVNQGTREYKQVFDQCTRMMMLLHEIPQPVICAVQGIATAAGCQLAAWCDLVVAADNARFSTPGVKIGLFCTTPMVAITRAIGRKAAMEMLLTGREFPATEAKDLGLINRVVALEDLADATMKLAEEIALASGFALAIGKQGLYAQADMTDGQALHYGKNTIIMNNTSVDAQNGISGFLNKTSAEWKNR